MSDLLAQGRTLARLTLAAIRLFNGTAALLAPAWLGRRLGVDPAANPAATYVLRMFGVRTVVLGAQLLGPPGPARARALRTGVLIHASDTAAALLAGAAGHLPRRAARLAALISCTNTILAIFAQAGE